MCTHLRILRIASYAPDRTYKYCTVHWKHYTRYVVLINTVLYAEKLHVANTCYNNKDIDSCPEDDSANEILYGTLNTYYKEDRQGRS